MHHACPSKKVTTVSVQIPLSDAPEICCLGVDALSSLYAKRSLSPVEVVTAALERASEVNRRFNAFTAIEADVALLEARMSEARWRTGNAQSPVDGVPITVKDLIHVEGFANRKGSRVTDNKAVMADAPSVAALRRGGAVVIGLTTTPEFGWKGVTDSPLCGVTRNPWNPHLTPGGSSGGAAVAAATGAGVLHVGTDGGGSNRIPASFTGTVGMKPTFGRIPLYPASMFGSVVHIGPIARQVSDIAYMLAVMACRDLRDWTQGHGPHGFARRESQSLDGLRIGYWESPVCGTLDTEVGSIIRGSVARIEKAGATIESFSIPEHFDVAKVFKDHWCVGASALLDSIPVERWHEIDPGLREIAQTGAKMTALEFRHAQLKRVKFGAWMDEQLERFDFVVSPATSILPFDVGCEVPGGSNQGRWFDWAGFSFPINLSQQPACVVPVGYSECGLPIGMQIIGPRGADERVLAVAAEVERVQCNSARAQL
jgi:aspartyl-tRNA(Asn)/glutamyl-tRNA(Gln) amidotransferase subunit A